MKTVGVLRYYIVYSQEGTLRASPKIPLKNLKYIYVNLIFPFQVKIKYVSSITHLIEYNLCIRFSRFKSCFLKRK